MTGFHCNPQAIESPDVQIVINKAVCVLRLTQFYGAYNLCCLSFALNGVRFTRPLRSIIKKHVLRVYHISQIGSPSDTSLCSRLQLLAFPGGEKFT